MIPFPNIDPVIFRIGPLSIRWYGIMYLIGFSVSYLLVRYQVRKKKIALNVKEIDSLYSFLIIGLIAGARLGYIIFYNPFYYLKNPLEIFAMWQGGMSFHGGLIGSIVAGIIICKKSRLDFWKVSDLVIVTAPIGLGLGRIGNFINGELFGRVTNVPWSMVFPDGGPFPRHPSQLYEFFLEGVLLFVVLWALKGKGFKPGVLSSLFLILYGLFRFFVEFFREPDPQLGFILEPFTMGQMLSVFMLVLGIGVMFIKVGRRCNKLS